MDGEVRTLGERLAALAEYIRLRHATTFSWAPALAPVLARLDSLNQSWAGRFERHEQQVPTGVRMPVDVRAPIREVAGSGADQMRVQVDAKADAEARAHHADAVTVGTTVKVRSGRYQPDTPEGLALLAHEASHVTELIERGADGRSTAGGVAAEEAAAAKVERLVVRLPDRFNPAGSAPPRARYDGLPPNHGHVPTSPDQVFPAAIRLPSTYDELAYGVHSHQINAVGASNHLLPAPPPSSAPPVAASAATTPMRAEVDRPEASPGPAQFDADGLRYSIVEELMRRLRTDSERGA
jgi:hypothetical protein